jgi:glycerophosphoryl diester phosphodiesterase
MKVIGHRGARGLAPENTLASLEKGLQHHVDELEFDLRVTKDNFVVLHHNRDVIDPNGKRRRISTHNLNELREHKKDLTTLSEALDFVGRTVPLYIEVKPGELTSPIIKILRSYINKGWKSDDFLLSSFNLRILRELHAALPDIEMIVNENWSGIRATHRARIVGAKRLSMNRRWLWSGFIRAMSNSGYKLVAFTVNDPMQAKRWKNYGLYGIVTDYPDRFEKKS